MEEKIKILLAEDDTNLGMLLKEYLRAKGFETVLCEDGEVAYEAFLNQPFDICILDVLSSPHYKEAICKAGDTDTIVTAQYFRIDFCITESSA